MLSTKQNHIDDVGKSMDAVPLAAFGDATEDAIALAFAEKYKDELRFDHTSGKWSKWDSARWGIENTDLAVHYAREICRDFNQTHHDKNLPKMRTASAVEKFARADRRFAVTHEHWDQNPWLLCTPEFTVDLATGSKHPNDPGNNITRCTSISPSNMPTPHWNDFLDQTTDGDKELQQFLQQICGYSLTASTREHALFFIHGTGGTGKTTFCNAITDVMGDYAVTAAMDTFTASKHDRHPTELARLKGARLVTASETEQGRAWAESKIKQLTGGDVISARFMRKDFFEFTPEFKLMFLGNHKPVLHNVDEAQRRRFNIIPFNVKPPERDTHLSEKLKKEYAGILQWAVGGCRDWRANGLVVPEVVRAETEAYFSDQDVFTQWLNESTEKKTENTGETSARLFADWKIWAQAQGENPGTSTTFAERMITSGFRKVKHTPGDRDKRGFVGIALEGETGTFKPYSD